ncbi:hypothetical protein [Caballeronia grimmiae]|uniref:hypothetical protein n=1 Tax=Caballeronia grimmiae TaxID=1071679 RepID=UPI0038B9E4E2
MDYYRHPELTLHAGYHCGCGLTPLKEAIDLSDDAAAAEIELALTAAKLLGTRYLPHLNLNGTLNAIAHASMNLRILQGGKLSSKVAGDYFATHPLLPLIKRMGLTAQPGTRLTEILKGRTAIRHPVEAIVVLRSLHSDWRHVEHVFAEPPPVASSTCSIQAKGPTQTSWTYQYRKEYRRRRTSERFARYAEMYRQRRAERPDANHCQLMRLLPGDARQVLNRAALLRAGFDVPTPANSAPYVARLDEELEAYIRERRRQSQEIPERITQRVLTRGFRRPHVLLQKKLAGRLPLATAAAKQCAESQRQWKERLMRLGKRAGP